MGRSIWRKGNEETVQCQAQRWLCCNTCSQCSADGRVGCHPEESLRSGTGRERRGAAVHTQTHTLTRTISRVLFSENNVIHTGLLLTFHQGAHPLWLQQTSVSVSQWFQSQSAHCSQRSSWTFNTTERAWLVVPTLSSLSLSLSVQWKEDFIVISTPAHCSASFWADQMVLCNLYLMDDSIFSG